MASSLTLIVIILIILVIFLALSLVKKLIQWAVVAAALIIIISVFTNINIEKDFLRLKQGEGETSIILVHDGDPFMGFTRTDGIEFLDDLDIDCGPEHKIYTYDTKLFESLETVTINNKEVSGEQIYALFEDDQLISSLTYEDFLVGVDFEDPKKTDKDLVYGVDFGVTPEVYKRGLFIYLHEKELKMTKSPLQFFRLYKEDLIEVCPETIFFTFSKIVPLSWIDEKLNKLKDTVGEIEKRGPDGFFR
ncbi:hypothetical protein GOV09_04335 [Candidatus Woesearchaeota archaeon]|nr:hypothetical protein [Candidatus Woesearchaeota archaeon]